MASVKRRATSPLTGGVKAPGTKSVKKVPAAKGQVTGTTVVTGNRPKKPSVKAIKAPNSGNNGGAPYPKEPATATVDFSNTSGGLPEGMQAQPSVGLGTAPITSQGQALRIDAQNQYNSSTAGINYAAYQAALQYGDPATLAQFNNLYGPTPDNPNSALNQIRRAEESGIQSVSDAALRNNTWRSTLRLNDQQKVSDEAGRQRLAAKNAWDRANFDWQLGLSDAWALLQRYLNQADQDDYNAWLATQPEPTGYTPAPSGGGVATLTPNQQRQRAQAQQREAQARARAQAQEDRARRSVKRKKK